MSTNDTTMQEKETVPGTAREQKHTENYSIYNSDCMYLMPAMDDESIDLSVYSPPFAGLYNYSSSINDLSNCSSKEQFLTQYEYVIAEIARITKPGRITAVHCQDIIGSAAGGSMWDFPHEIIKLHEKYGFQYRNRITIWKEPLKVRMRTMVRSLMHKLIVEDSTECFTAMPDYVLVFKRKGENQVPVVHPRGLTEYSGDTPILDNILSAWNNANKSDLSKTELWDHLQTAFADHEDPKSNRLSHYIWQRYASSVWDDVRINNILPFKEARGEDDEKHVHPLQLDVIDRLIDLYTNPDEVVFTPFMGVGSEVYSAVRKGRKGIGVELKESYYAQAEANLEDIQELSPMDMKKRGIQKSDEDQLSLLS